MTSQTRHRPRDRALPAPAITDEQRRSAVVALIGRGLDLEPDDPRGVAHTIADALGLLRRPVRTYRQSPLTGRADKPAHTPEGTTPSVSVPLQSGGAS